MGFNAVQSNSSTMATATTTRANAKTNIESKTSSRWLVAQKLTTRTHTHTPYLHQRPAALDHAFGGVVLLVAELHQFHRGIVDPSINQSTNQRQPQSIKGQQPHAHRP